MKKLFKALLVTILAVVAVGFYTVRAEELEGQENENKATEVVETTKEEKPVVAATTESNRKEETKKEEVKVEEAKKSEAPKTEEPTVEDTKTEEPKVEETKSEPKKEEAPETPTEPTTKADADEPAVGKVTVKIIDTRTGSAVKTIDLLSTDESNYTISLKDLYSSMSYNSTDKAFYINETLYKHKFLGFYDAEEGGNQIVFSYNNTVYPNLKTIYANATQTSTANYKLTLRAKSDLTSQSTYNVYARFETIAKPNGKITINVIDSRTGNVVDSLITYATDGGTNSTNSKTLKTFFPNIYTSGSNLEDQLNGKKYIFKGFYTSADGTTKITKSFTPGTDYPDLGTLKVSSDLTTSNWQNHKLQAVAKSTVAEDNTYNIYALWDEKKSTKLTIIFKELSESGTELNDTQNEVSLSITNTIELGNGQTQKSVKLKVTEFISGDYRYIVDGWYEEDGTTPVPSSMYVNGDPLQIKVPFTCTEDSPDELTLTYILKWKEYLNPKYTFDVIDEVSDGDAHWDNTSGHFGEYSHKFKTPSSKTYYKFVNYRMDDVVKNAGETYTHDISAQGYGTEVEETFYAWWKADVTLILLDGSKELGRDSSFESIKISDILDENPTKEGYRFLGWVDGDDNNVDEDTEFEPDDESTKPTPKEVKLYAKWEKVVKFTVNKTWDDGEDEQGKRTSTVTVHVKNGEETVETIELGEDNKWTHEFELPELDGETPIEYTVEEDEVDGYNTYITGSLKEGFEILNVLYYEVVTITKEWDDFDGEDGLRPTSVTVRLYADEDEVGSSELNTENEWTAKFEKLDAYKDGEKIEYTVTEDEDKDLVDYYELVSITGSPEEGFTVLNKEIMGQGGDPEEEEPTNNNPKTGDNIISYVIMLMVSLTGFASAVAYLKNNKLAMNK